MANTGTIELEFNPSLDGLMDDGVRANSQGELETARQILGTDYPRAVAEHFEDPEDPSAQVATARGKRNFGFVFVRMALADDQPDHLAAAEHQLEESAGITRSLIFGNSLPPSDGAAEPSYFNEKSISRLHEEHGATLDVAGRVKGAMATFAIGQNRQDLLAEQRRLELEALESHSRGDNPYFEAVAKANLYICEDRIAGRSSTAAIRMLGSWLVNEFSSGITLSNDEIAAKRTLLGRAKLVLQHGSEAASRLKP